MTQGGVVKIRSIDRQPGPDPLPAEAGITGTPARILRAGLDLFAEQGYHATSIRDIASGAGIQSASLYAHFASKEAILAKLVLTGHEVLNRTLMAALLSSGTDARDQLQALVRAHVTAHCRYSLLAIVTAHESVHLDEAARAPSHALRVASEMLAADVVDRGVAQGLFHLIDREITLVAIGSLGVSASMWYRSRTDQITPERVGEVYADLVLRMVGSHGDGPADTTAPSA